MISKEVPTRCAEHAEQKDAATLHLQDSPNIYVAAVRACCSRETGLAKTRRAPSRLLQQGCKVYVLMVTALDRKVVQKRLYFNSEIENVFSNMLHPPSLNSSYDSEGVFNCDPFELLKCCFFFYGSCRPGCVPGQQLLKGPHPAGRGGRRR